MTPVKFFVKWGEKGCWCLTVPIFMILQALLPSAVRSSLAFIIQDYPSTDELTRSDKITAQGSIPAGKTKVALESFSHSLEHVNVQLSEVLQQQGNTGSPVNAVASVWWRHAWLASTGYWKPSTSTFIKHHQHKPYVIVQANELVA